MSAAAMDPAGRPIVEVDLAALCKNYRRFAEAQPLSAAAAVVKCNAYGLGAVEISRVLAEKENCSTFFVAYPQEGAALRGGLHEICPQAEIFVFLGPTPATLALYRDAALTPVLNSLPQAALWAREGGGAPAALHVDTGLNRLAAPPQEIDAIADLDGLKITWLMSHLATGYDPQAPENERQRAAYEAVAARFPAARRSLAASGGALLGPAYGLDMTRLGVGLYGVDPQEGPDDSGVVRPVARLTAEILEVQTIPPGARVGYGGTFTADRSTRLATAALGYGDGFPRAGSNRAMTIIGGAPCPIVGRISMDLITIDATDAPSIVKVGDRAEFFGPALSIDRQAAACGTIGYELLTGLGPRVVRRYHWSGRAA